jgi:predicted transcriptional regulator
MAKFSIPDSLFDAADRLAHRVGFSRSRLYVRTIERFLAEELKDDVTAHLNEIYAREDSPLDAGMAAAQRRAVVDKW